MNKAKLFYFIFYAAMAALSPFLTLYYQSLGLSGTQIGLLAGLVPLTGMLSGTLWTVSYTHLDVYKRQVPSSRRWRHG